MGVRAAQVSRSFERLNGSLTLLVEHPEGRRWTFRHPTITDAFAGLVADSAELVELYIRGAKLERLLIEVVCGPFAIAGAKVRVPAALYPVLLARLRAHPLDSTLRHFLINRCDRRFLVLYIDNIPEVFNLSGHLQPDLAYDSYAPLLAKLNSLDLLPESVRQEAVARIEDATLTWFDAGIFREPNLRSILTEDEFSRLCVRFKEQWFDDLLTLGVQFSSTDQASLLRSLRENLEHVANFFGGRPEIDKMFTRALSSIDEDLAEL